MYRHVQTQTPEIEEAPVQERIDKSQLSTPAPEDQGPSVASDDNDEPSVASDDNDEPSVDWDPDSNYHKRLWRGKGRKAQDTSTDRTTTTRSRG